MPLLLVPLVLLLSLFDSGTDECGKDEEEEEAEVEVEEEEVAASVSERVLAKGGLGV